MLKLQIQYNLLNQTQLYCLHLTKIDVGFDRLHNWMKWRSKQVTQIESKYPNNISSTFSGEKFRVMEK